MKALSHRAQTRLATALMALAVGAVLASAYAAGGRECLAWAAIGGCFGALQGLRRRRWALAACDLPAWLRVSFNRFGVEFERKGDTVIWTWPWKCKAERRARGPWISLGFTGNGFFGDSRHHTLADLDREWAQYEEAERACQARDAERPQVPWEGA